MRVKSGSLLLIAFLLVAVGTADGQENVLVLLRPSTGESNLCSMGGEPRLVTIRDYKIGGKGDVRVGLGQDSSGLSVSRDQFNRMRKLRLRDLVELEVKNGLMYVSAGDGQKMAAVPDVEPGRGSQIALSQYMEMSLEGETRDGRSRQKQMLPVKTIWKMFVLTPSLTVEEALFRHAQQEASVGQWTFFLGKVPSHRVKEASDGLAQSTTGCIDRAMERFRGGEFRAIQEARELGQKLVAMSAGTGPASERLAAIRNEEQGVTDRIRTGRQLSREQKWDDALSAWEPVTKYLKDQSQKDFADAYAETLTKSHDSHMEAARAAEQSGGMRGLTYEPGSDAPLRQALKEFELALTRRPNSDQARQGRREMLIRLALIDARRFRTAKEPGRARDVLVKVGAEHGEDTRVSAELKEASCEFGAQLFEQARTMVTVAMASSASRPTPAPKPVATKTGTTPKKAAPTSPAAPTSRVRTIQGQTDKGPFSAARQKLGQAVGLCPSDEKVQLLANVNTALADYHVAQAKKAMLRKLSATALLHLNAAQAFQAERSDLDALLAQAREPVQQRAQIQAGVVISSISNECAEVAQQVAGAVESALVGGGIANIQLLARDQAQNILRRMRTGSAAASGINYALVSGQIGACTLIVTDQRRQVPSKLQIPNGNYPSLKAAEDEANRAFDQCKAANGEQACLQQKNYRDQARNRRSREQPYFLRDYSYEEQPITVSGQMRLTLHVDDSILRGTRPVGEASGSVSETCVARRGVQENDWGQGSSAAGSGASGWRGLLEGLAARRQIPPNVECSQVHRESKLLQMAEQVKDQAQRQAAAAIGGVARSYFELAKRATDQDVALENYITFALLSADKSGQEYQQAITALRGRDADLKPESALR